MGHVAAAIEVQNELDAPLKIAAPILGVFSSVYVYSTDKWARYK